MATKLDKNWVETIRRRHANLALDLNALVSEIERLEAQVEKLEVDNCYLQDQLKARKPQEEHDRLTKAEVKFLKKETGGTA